MVSIPNSDGTHHEDEDKLLAAHELLAYLLLVRERLRCGNEPVPPIERWRHLWGPSGGDEH